MNLLGFWGQKVSEVKVTLSRWRRPALDTAIEFSFLVGFIFIGCLYVKGADSMRAMGVIAPMAKKLWGLCPKVAPTGILLLPLYAAKRYSKNYKCVIMKVKRVH